MDLVAQSLILPINGYSFKLVRTLAFLHVAGSNDDDVILFRCLINLGMSKCS